MGISLKKIKKKIGIKNISPVAMVASTVKKPAEKIIKTGKFGIKDAISVSPLGVTSSIVKSGRSNIRDVVVNKRMIERDSDSVFVDEKSNKTEENNIVPEIKKESIKSDKNKKFLYIGLGVGILLLVGGIVYKIRKK